MPGAKSGRLENIRACTLKREMYDEALMNRMNIKIQKGPWIRRSQCAWNKNQETRTKRKADSMFWSRSASLENMFNGGHILFFFSHYPWTKKLGSQKDSKRKEKKKKHENEKSENWKKKQYKTLENTENQSILRNEKILSMALICEHGRKC